MATRRALKRKRGLSDSDRFGTRKPNPVEVPKTTGNCVDVKSIDSTPAPPGDRVQQRNAEFSPPCLPNGGEDSGSKKIDQEQRSQSSGSVDTGSVRKKRRTRRAKRRRYKPYHKLSFEEKQELAERETKRAEKFRAERFAHGHAMAPYNTTQFLLEDREARNLEPDVDALMENLHHRDSRERTYSGTGSFDSEGGTSETGSSAGISDSLSFDRDFEVEYESAKAERLESMTKEGLVRDYVVIEQDLERSRVESKDLRDMVNRLRKENANLRTKLANSGVLPRPASAPVSGRRLYSVGNNSEEALQAQISSQKS